MKQAFAMFCLVGLFAPAWAGFTTADTTRAMTSRDCLDWRIKGVCLKLNCGLFGCRVRSRPWVEHRLPDLIVSVYNQPGEIPWKEARGLYGQALKTTLQSVMRGLSGVPAGGGHFESIRPETGPERRVSTSNLRFKEVSVIGHPAIQAFRESLTPDAPLLCSTQVRPLMPYFSSEVDGVVWRTGVTEQALPDTWMPWRRPIGTWGSVYPRQGLVHQYYDSLAAAVVAQRAVDIVTRTGQPHRYRQVPGVDPSQEKTDQWQMIYPRSESQCLPFGQARYFQGRENNIGPNAGAYGWVYWPLHQCCPGSGVLITKLPF